MENYEREHLDALRPYLSECMVLLKKNGKFPLDVPCRLAAYGSGVNYTVKGGTGSGEVNSRFFININQGLREAGFDLSADEWARQYSQYLDHASRKFKEQIRDRAKREKINVIAASMGAVMLQPEYNIPMDYSCDAAIYVVSRISGEGNDRLPAKGDFLLTDSEVRDILKLNSHYDRFMLIINAGGPVDLTPVMEVGNILVMSQLGVESGAAIADVLLGRSTPSGKLTTTWAGWGGYCMKGDFGERDDTRYREGIYVGYRYFDSFGVKPLFPFGYGLSYTDFKVARSAVKADGARLEVSAAVTNIGKFRGKETLQVYVSCPAGRLDREAKSLAGFVKTGMLEPGESETVTASFDIRDLAAFDEENAAYILEAGDYIVLIGTDSASVKPAAVIRLREEFVTRKSERLFPGADYDDMKSSSERVYTAPRNTRVIEPDLSGCPGCTAAGSPDEPVPAGRSLPDSVSVDQLAYLNIGGFDPKKPLAGVIGDSAMSVAGAAGETSAVLKDEGIGSLIMADGPAGVRIARQYYEDKKGKKHSLGSAIPESMMEMMPKAAQKIIEKGSRLPRGAEVHEQYCTALPIGTAIAQSWNLEFAELCGDIVGDEMERFGIDLWLAPALNIHRNVLCGRNFEYFSEDPLVSGLFAAALTRGVHRHPGLGTTIKHYAANNQETNRYANNSMISERALREIYLKGFGICIKESDPVSIMTSYNLLNGEHTSESKALTRVLREEFGFDGLIMTDWVIGGNLLLMKGSKYGTPDPALVAAAGCSLFMPGRKDDHKRILKGVSEGRVTVDQLRCNAQQLLHVMDRLGKM